MSEDILVKAESLCTNCPHGNICPCDAIYCIPELVKEIERLLSLNPFGEDVSVAIRINDNLFLYGNNKVTGKLQEQLVAMGAEIRKWQKTAVEERAQNNMQDRGPNGECRASAEHQSAGYPRCVYCQDTGDYHDCPMLGFFMNQAAKELGIQIDQDTLEKIEHV